MARGAERYRHTYTYNDKIKDEIEKNMYEDKSDESLIEMIDKKFDTMTSKFSNYLKKVTKANLLRDARQYFEH